MLCDECVFALHTVSLAFAVKGPTVCVGNEFHRYVTILGTNQDSKVDLANICKAQCEAVPSCEAALFREETRHCLLLGQSLKVNFRACSLC